MAWVTVQEWERVVRFRRGALVAELGPGRHRVPAADQVHRVDLRPRSMTLAGQEIPTADGLLVRVTAVLRWSATDPVRFVRTAAAPADDLYLAVQLGLRQAVLSRAHDALDAQRRQIGAEVAASVAERAGELGTAVSEVAVRDAVLPVELRRPAVAELVAKREGRAMLERARAEAAALRVLLNVAELAEKHPALLQLRTLQAASTPGSTVVLERGR